MLKRKEKSSKNSLGISLYHGRPKLLEMFRMDVLWNEKQIVGCQEGKKQGHAGMLKSHSLYIFDKWILSLTCKNIFQMLPKPFSVLLS